jgi:hypothetical protein
MLFLNRSATMNSEQYVHTLKMLKQWLWRVQSNINTNQLLILPTVLT